MAAHAASAATPVHGMTPVMSGAAMDVFSLFVIAIIIFNIVAPLLRSLARSLGGAANRADAEARQRADQSLPPSSPASTSAAARAAELARLRRALLASAGVPEPAGDAQDAAAAAGSPTTAPTPPPVVVTASTTAAPISPAPAAVSQLRPASLQPTRAMRKARRVAAQPSAPVARLAARPATLSGWATQDQGSLLTLQSADSAFEVPTLPGGPGAVTGAGGAPLALGILQGPDSGMNLFIAAAIVGPCAAFRPLGHTPGGW